jgi:hypothetical protein
LKSYSWLIWGPTNLVSVAHRRRLTRRGGRCVGFA